MVATQDETQQILIVEDDANAAQAMVSIMRDAGFRAQAVNEGRAAINRPHIHLADLILLDLDLPDMNGLDILKHVRQTSFVPIIVISGVSSQKEKVAALEFGADDFLEKPFSPDELLARTKAILRRVDWMPDIKTTLQVRQLKLELPFRQASVRGQKLHLTPIEYGLLTILMHRAGEIISHNDLLLSVWGDNYKGDYSVLRVNISRLRQKVEDDPRHPTYIVTVAGRGYTMPLKITPP